jgi:hypothetical protein
VIDTIRSVAEVTAGPQPQGGPSHGIRQYKGIEVADVRTQLLHGSAAPVAYVPPEDRETWTQAIVYAARPDDGSADGLD